MIGTRRLGSSVSTLPLLWLAGTFFAAGALVALHYAVLPGSICVFRSISGVPCPTCGLTRAFTELTHAHFAGATHLHPLAIPLAIEMALGWILLGATLAGWKARVPLRTVIVVAALHAAMFLSVWIYRLAAGTLPV